MKHSNRLWFSFIGVMLGTLLVFAPLASAQQLGNLPPQLVQIVGQWGVTPEALGTLVQNLATAQGDQDKIVEALTTANIDPKLLRRFLNDTDPKLVDPLLQAVGIDPATLPDILTAFDQSAFDAQMAKDDLTQEELDALIASADIDALNALLEEDQITSADFAQYLWFYSYTTVEDPYDITPDVLTGYVSVSFETPEEVLAFWGITEDGLKAFLAQVGEGADMMELAAQFGFAPTDVLDIVYSLSGTDYATGLLEEAGINADDFYTQIDEINTAVMEEAQNTEGTDAGTDSTGGGSTEEEPTATPSS